MNIPLLVDATLPDLEQAFPPPFRLTRYHDLTELAAALPSHQALICRSTLKIDASLLHNSSLEWVLTASSGRDHIDESCLTRQNIRLLDAKGANAQAVVDYTLSCIAYLERYFDFQPKSIGIIGMGAVGSLLAATLRNLSFDLFPYDPLRAQHDKHFHSHALEAIRCCDLVCLHPNLHHTVPHSSYHLIEADFLSHRSSRSAIINAARGNVVHELDLLTHHQGIYCTDVFANEPFIANNIVQHAAICTPHIAGHSIEAKHAVIRVLSRQLHQAFGLSQPFSANDPGLPLKMQRLALIDWKTQALSTYNPHLETQTLKKAHNVAETFLSLRSQHVRHELNA